MSRAQSKFALPSNTILWRLLPSVAVKNCHLLQSTPGDGSDALDLSCTAQVAATEFLFGVRRRRPDPYTNFRPVNKVQVRSRLPHFL